MIKMRISCGISLLLLRKRGFRGFRGSSNYLPSYNRGNTGNSVNYVQPEIVEKKTEMESTLVASIIDWF